MTEYYYPNFINTCYIDIFSSTRIYALLWRIFFFLIQKENELLPSIVRMTGLPIMRRKLLRRLYFPILKKWMLGPKVLHYFKYCYAKFWSQRVEAFELVLVITLSNLNGDVILVYSVPLLVGFFLFSFKRQAIIILKWNRSTVCSLTISLDSTFPA